MTMHALDLNYRSQGSRCLLGVGWIIINYIYIIIHNNIYTYFEGMESSVILVRCPQMMLLKQCIRRAVQEGLIHPSGHAFFFPHFQFSPLSAMPALLTCPAASEVAAPGGPSIDVGEVIRQNLERTRAQDGLSAVWINNYYYIRIEGILVCRMWLPWRWLARPAVHQRWSLWRTPTSVDWYCEKGSGLCKHRKTLVWSC